MEEQMYKIETDGTVNKILMKIKTQKLLKKCQQSHEKIKKAFPQNKDNIYTHVIIHHTNDELIPITCYRGYNTIGELSPMVFIDSNTNELIPKESSDLSKEICEIDLYEKSIFVYDLEEEKGNINGKLIKTDIKGNVQNIVFTEDKFHAMKINVNAMKVYNSFPEYIENSYL